MVVYNRRKRAIYYQEQERQQAQILQLARDAVVSGSATPAQRALVDGIREEEEAMEKKKSERKFGSRILWWMHGDWKEDKELQEQRKLAMEEAQRSLSEQPAQTQDLGITQAVQEARANATGHTTVGGPLDQAAAKAVDSAEKTGKGWLGWAFGGSKKS
jgi:hypothetical protein